jgi:glutaredoxin
MHKTDITKGFQIDEPNVFISWDIDEVTLINLLDEYDLKKVTDGYYCISCKSLGGLSHELGFHFATKIDKKSNKDLEDYIKSIGTIIKKFGPACDSKEIGKLRELEFFRKTYPDLKKSFDEFQQSFEREFGQPSHSEKGEDGFQHHEWRFRQIRIYHYVLYRFGPEEHVIIRRA